MPTTQVKCSNASCKYGQDWFSDADPLADELRKKSGYVTVEHVFNCPDRGCREVFLHQNEPEHAVISSSAQSANPGAGYTAMPESYGALVLCCDCSGSMTKNNRYNLVIDSLASLFRDFCDTPANRPGHYDKVLMALVPYGERAVPAEIGGSPWFTLKQLHEQYKWEEDPVEHLLKTSDIAKTLRELMPIGEKTGIAGTNIAEALEKVRELATDLFPGPPKKKVPTNFGGLNMIPGEEQHRQFWMVLYSDGHAEQEGKTPAECAKDASASGKRLADEVPKLNRITVFFGTRGDGDQLMEELAGTCIAKGHESKRAYFGPDKAHHLRKIIHTATQADYAGFCQECLKRAMRS